MKSMRLPSAAIFFMTYFHRAGGGHGPSAPPPGSATVIIRRCKDADYVMILLPWLQDVGLRIRGGN